jgi:glycosyltransferase involved in cell wall biosynthesis
MPPAVSIILPTFNRLEFLPAAIASAFAQCFSDWELIVADDGSSGATRTYLRSLDDPPRVRIIWLAHCGKPSAVRNAAVRAARGEYLAFLDSDDVWLPGKLATQIASLRRHPQRLWSYTRFAQVDAAGQPRVTANTTSWPAPCGWILEKLLKEETVIALPSVVVSRQLLQRIGGFDEELVMCEDDELWLRLAAHSEIDGVDEPLTLIRRHAQHSGSDTAAWRDRKRVFEKALRTGASSQHEAVLRKQRVAMATGLAKSQAASGERINVLGTLIASAPYSWRYREWWLGALAATAKAFVPATAQAVIRRYRHRESAHAGARRS